MNKDDLFNLIFGTILVVLLFMTFSSIINGIGENEFTNQRYQIDLYADHHHSQQDHFLYLPIVLK